MWSAFRTTPAFVSSISTSSPKPLLIFQGRSDSLFPPDLCYYVARQVQHIYDRLRASDNSAFEIVEGEHSWDYGRIGLLGRYLASKLEAPSQGDMVPEDEALLSPDDGCLDSWPPDALSADALAQELTGVTVQPGLDLWEVFPPRLAAGEIEQITPRGDTRDILAQFEAFLKPEPE